MMMGGWGKSMYAVDKTIKRIIIIWNVEKAIRINMKNIAKLTWKGNVYLPLLSLLIVARSHSASQTAVGL